MIRESAGYCVRGLAVFLSIFGGILEASDTRVVSFEHDVRPLLIRHCDRCHGAKNQEGGLQLNLRTSVLHREGAGESVVVPGDADQSQLIHRLTDVSFGDVMPLDGNRLGRDDIDILRRWIDQGADWPDRFAKADHWAWKSVVRPNVPGSMPELGPVDQFIARRLSSESVKSVPVLDRPRLIRRASLALNGVPPTPDEVAHFVADRSPGAYETVIDRLLASPRYGERWAVPWMDLARYADSNGFQADQLRDNWAWRDWVIRAFNTDMPFDQFVIDQLAGDLRADASVEQRIATGFHRMTTCNVEAGVHPEANRVNQIVDRVNTTATAFLGITLECSQCHDHKYDPFTQEDYYRFFAYFNNSPLEVSQTQGVTWDFYGPQMELPLDDATQKKQTALQHQITELRDQKRSVIQRAAGDFKAWQRVLRASSSGGRWAVATPDSFEVTAGSEFEVLPDGSVLLAGTPRANERQTVVLELPDGPVTALRLEALADATLPGNGPGRHNKANPDFELRSVYCELIRDGEDEPVDVASAAADFSSVGSYVTGVIDDDPDTGWSIGPKFGEPHWARLEFSEPIVRRNSHGLLRVVLSYGRSSIGRLRIALSMSDPSTLDVNDAMLAAVKNENPDVEEQKLLRREFESRQPQAAKLKAKISRVQHELEQIEPDTTLVMVEMDQPRDTFILARGDYDQPGDRVTPDTPVALPPIDSVPRTGDRMELARWLTSATNPLFARVTVNRWWAELFGAGLVTTSEDFGTQADAPSHPELLDWLASEFVSSGWSMKHIHKLIVMSRAWCQGAVNTMGGRSRDPLNRLLWRGPRFRLPAESIRDNALAVSGLLSSKMYGAPVMPHQPDGVWRSVGRNQPKWKPAQNGDRFRRGVYVICKRAAPYPSFTTFDAPGRSSCTVQRTRSNTPLQALTLLNDRAYSEMALAFADRVLTEAPIATDAGRIEYAMQLAVCRNCELREIAILQHLLDRERVRLAEHPEDAELRLKLTAPGVELRYGEPLEVATWFAVTNAILNLDETMTQ